MGDVYFRRDIANVLRAIACANNGSGLAVTAELTGDSVQEKMVYAYRLGVRNTLVSVGLAFGLEPSSPITSQEREGDSAFILLWKEASRP